MTPDQKVTTTARALARAEGRSEDARTARDDAVRSALAQGLSLRQVAEAAGISHQRVAKIAQG